MISPRPSLSATTSTDSTSSSEAEISEDEVVSVPTQTTVSVGSIVVQPEATMPGVLLGTLNNTYVNLLVNPGIGRRTGDIRPEDLNDLVTDAVKINSETVKSFIPTDINSSSNKLTGTKEDVEGLTRRWCYLITALVTLSLITLLGTAVLSLTSWRTSQSSILATTPTDATRATIEGLSAEEKQFAAVDGSPAIVGRTEWVAQPNKWRVKNTLPVRRVVVDDTMTDLCGTPAECVEIVRTMQMVDIEQRHQPDVRDNFLIGGDVAAIAGGPKIVTRSMWLATPPRESLDSNTLPVTTVVVCHTATGNCNSRPECIENTRAVQRFHQESRHWADVSYNFLIGGDGSVYWGRGFDYMGAHTKGYNKGSIAVAFIGTFIDVAPDATQIEAFARLIRVGLKEGKISPDYTLVAQCQLQVTAAPGLALVRRMTSWPHYNSSLPAMCTAG